MLNTNIFDFNTIDNSIIEVVETSFNNSDEDRNNKENITNDGS